MTFSSVRRNNFVQQNYFLDFEITEVDYMLI